MRADRGDWIGTYSGELFWPLDPRPEEVSIHDIVAGLSKECRYGNQCRRFYSVAEHCVLVSRHVPEEYAREALLHDSAEAYIGDMSRPVKHSPEMVAFRKMERVIERAVFARFDIRSTPASHRAVKAVDERIVIDEVFALMARPEKYLQRHPNVKPLGVVIEAWSHSRAESEFSSRFLELFGYFYDEENRRR